MRDLPPQVQAIVLEQPAPAFLALPQLAMGHAVFLLDHEDRSCAPWAAPLDTERLHAAPVGIVRLLT